MSERHHDEPAPPPRTGLRLEDLAEKQGAHVVENLEGLKADVWASDEELAAFLADLRVSRNASEGLADDPG